MPDTEDYVDVAPEQQSERDRRSLGTLGTILLIITVVIVVLLFWRSCGADEQAGETPSSGGVITTVPGLERMDAGVAVWVKPGTDIEALLDRNGLGDADYSDFGEGTFVIKVDEGEAERVVAKLKRDEWLYDAGFLYADDQTE